MMHEMICIAVSVLKVDIPFGGAEAVVPRYRY